MNPLYVSACQCPERLKSPTRRKWVVRHRRHNHSAFNGYKWTPSAYSAIQCGACGASWRTRAAFVAFLKDKDLDL